MNVIYKIIYGSHAFGTVTDNESDTDIRGIYMPTIEDHISLREHKTITLGSATGGNKIDIVLHPLRKYVQLAYDCNPSCIEWLFVPRNLVLETTRAGKRLIRNRDMFLSKEVYYKFKGFATSEFKRITEITRRAGARRKELHVKCGYDPKTASNVVRLLNEGIEILKDKTITIPRPERNWLKEIKNGRCQLEDIRVEIDKLFVDIDEAYKLSTLPDKCDFEKTNELLINIVMEYGKKGKDEQVDD